MNSGIGNPEHLSEHGIQSIVDLPDVGKNIFDHPIGVYATGISQHIGLGRVPDNSNIFANAPNPAPGPGSPHFEILLSNFILGPTPPEENYLSITTFLSTPGDNARGSVKLNLSDPLAVPLIDAGLLADNATDVPLMREAIKTVLRLVSAPAWEDDIIGPVDSTQPSLNATCRVGHIH
ncbi:unnamed protein product [Cyclocybe aegerita]|uniref:Glucose-methanol-choline oxidoreductase N-terminal domain-containing protein n=1 Tax=Cyclocybe aegerita TaxID=1973307 RepID=A0A8S0VR34_CYCAE|nr:unnamed protein product [Cyclocybe aegerita]